MSAESARPVRWWRRAVGGVGAFIPALSLSLLAPVPIIHAAIKLRSWKHGVVGALYTAALLGAVLIEPEPGWVDGAIIGLMVVPTVHALVVRRRVFDLQEVDPAI